MKKYELRRNTMEVSNKDKAEIYQGCTLSQSDQIPEIICSFENEHEALEELKKYESTVEKFQTYSGCAFSVIEYYVEANVYDDEGEWESGGDVIDFAEMIEK